MIKRCLVPRHKGHLDSKLYKKLRSCKGQEVTAQGTGKNISLNEVVQTVLQYFPELKFKFVEGHPGEVKETVVNIEPLCSLVWKANIELEASTYKCFK